MNKETSSHVSTIAARIMRTPEAANGPMVEPIDYNSLLEDAKILAGSCLSQDETAGQSEVKHDFYDRLKNERDELYGRLTALNSYVTHNPGHPNPRHHEMLCRQAIAMSEYLAILDERIADIEISRRSELNEATTARPNEDITEQDD